MPQSWARCADDPKCAGARAPWPDVHAGVCFAPTPIPSPALRRAATSSCVGRRRVVRGPRRRRRGPRRRGDAVGGGVDRRRGRASPFFVMVGLEAAHPFEAPPPFYAAVDAASAGAPPALAARQTFPIGTTTRPGPRDRSAVPAARSREDQEGGAALDATTLRAARATPPYAAAVAYVDHNVGALTAAAQRRRRSTVGFRDHGDSLGERHVVQVVAVHVGGAVPLLVRAPSLPRSAAAARAPSSS